MNSLKIVLVVQGKEVSVFLFAILKDNLVDDELTISLYDFVSAFLCEGQDDAVEKEIVHLSQEETSLNIKCCCDLRNYLYNLFDVTGYCVDILDDFIRLAHRLSHN